MMAQSDCGAIPVVENTSNKKLAGIVTDRDIVCRTVAENKNPLELTVESCMSQTVVTTTPETSLEECCNLMEEHQIRRIPVVDQKGVCCGIVAQADVAIQGSEEDAAEMVREVSQPPRAADIH
jgi:CBS domain-containing protein